MGSSQSKEVSLFLCQHDIPTMACATSSYVIFTSCMRMCITWSARLAAAVESTRASCKHYMHCRTSCAAHAVLFSRFARHLHAAQAALVRDRQCLQGKQVNQLLLRLRLIRHRLTAWTRCPLHPLLPSVPAAPPPHAVAGTAEL
jgi:hypothetical protein